LSASDRVLHALPNFHIGGVVDVLLAPLLAGGSVICAPAFSAPRFYEDLEQLSPTWVQLVPVMLAELLRNQDRHKNIIDNHSLRFLRSVSARLPETERQQFEQLFNIPIIEIYGMTEAAGVITSNLLPPAIRKPGSVGIPIGVNLQIRDSSGQAAGPGHRGEILISGKSVIARYENAADENETLFDQEWFRTGDTGYVDTDGYLFLTGRVKDMINRGGEKVLPQEVDDMLLSHPDIKDAAVFPIDDADLGEEVAAAIVVVEGKELPIPAIREFLADKLAFFKIPRKFCFTDTIPRSANGKIQRATLKQVFAELITGEDHSAQYIEPNSVLTRAIADIWKGILELDKVGLNDNFFDLGGNSLKGASFINQVQELWGETVYVSSLFDAPTPALYEKYLNLHYPDVVAKATGAAVSKTAQRDAPVDDSMLESFRGMIANPSNFKSPQRDKKNPRAIFVLSPPRSGSTLLRAMLAGNPQLFAPPELYLLSYETLVDRKNWYSGSHRSQLEGNIRAMMQARSESLEACEDLMRQYEAENMQVVDYYALLQEWIGSQILVDKTPAYSVDLMTLQKAEEYFEDVFYVHLLRHPYGMIRSFEEAKLDQLWFPRLRGEDSVTLEPFPFTRKQIAEMIWILLHQNILEFLKNIDPSRQCKIVFEDLVSDPATVMQAFCDAAGIGFDPGMLEPQKGSPSRMTDGLHDGSRMIGDPKFHTFNKIESSVADQWKSAFTDDFLGDLAWELARKLGYEESVASVRGREILEF